MTKVMIWKPTGKYIHQKFYMMKSRKPSFSKIIKTEVVCPNDSNPVGILLGGQLVQWMDIAAAICAQTHAGKICVTASIDSVSFKNPAHVGDVVTIEAKITRAFTTSMEIIVWAWTSNVRTLKKRLISESYFTFVAIDETGKPSSVIPVAPVTPAEHTTFAEALKRKKKK
jgi:acyl-CoA hydrolase